MTYGDPFMLRMELSGIGSFIKRFLTKTKCMQEIYGCYYVLKIASLKYYRASSKYEIEKAAIWQRFLKSGKYRHTPFKYFLNKIYIITGLFSIF